MKRFIKKFISLFLIVALIVCSSSTFLSCKQEEAPETIAVNSVIYPQMSELTAVEPKIDVFQSWGVMGDPYIPY
ncbi:MAG: hypothetical protein IJY04_05250, partial [Clostridia bacterium]|nr:hypothetical protein [Clostridia bacterium]